MFCAVILGSIALGGYRELFFLFVCIRKSNRNIFVCYGRRYRYRCFRTVVAVRCLVALLRERNGCSKRHVRNGPGIGLAVRLGTCLFLCIRKRKFGIIIVVGDREVRKSLDLLISQAFKGLGQRNIVADHVVDKRDRVVPFPDNIGVAS